IRLDLHDTFTATVEASQGVGIRALGGPTGLAIAPWTVEFERQVRGAHTEPIRDGLAEHTQEERQPVAPEHALRPASEPPIEDGELPTVRPPPTPRLDPGRIHVLEPESRHRARPLRQPHAHERRLLLFAFGYSRQRRQPGEASPDCFRFT